MDMVFDHGRTRRQVEDDVAAYIRDNDIRLCEGIPTFFIYQDCDGADKMMMMDDVFRLGKFIHDGLTDFHERCLVMFDRNVGATYVMYTKHTDAVLPELLTMAVVGNA